MTDYYIESLLHNMEKEKGNEKEMIRSEKRNRCFQCSRKVGLTGYDCSCQHMFCMKCRHAELHNCTFNYAKVGKELLEKNNPVVKGSTLNRME